MSQAPQVERTLTEELGLLVSLVWSDRRRFALVLLATIGISVGVSFLLTPRYTSTASVLPGTNGLRLGGMLGELGALSGLAGLDMGSGGIDAYPVVARSHTIVSRVLAAQYKDITVQDVLLDGEAADAIAVENVAKHLRTTLVTSKDLRSGSMKFEFTHEDPDFAAFVLNTMLDNLDAYFRESSGKEAREQRQLIDERIAQVGQEVQSAEDELRLFRTSNRAVMSSPLLALEEGRLIRQVEIKNRVYMELAAQLEMARIREAGSVTVLKILDRATRPQQKSWPRRSLIVLASVAGVAIAYVGWLRLRPQVGAGASAT